MAKSYNSTILRLFRFCDSSDSTIFPILLFYQFLLSDSKIFPILLFYQFSFSDSTIFPILLLSDSKIFPILLFNQFSFSQESPNALLRMYVPRSKIMNAPKYKTQ